MLRFLQEKEAVYGGDYAYRIELTSQQQAETLMQGKNIENVSLLRFAGSSFYGEPSNKNLLAIAEINDAFVENFIWNNIYWKAVTRSMKMKLS